MAATGDGLTYQWYYKDTDDSTYTKSTHTTSTYSVTMQGSWNGRTMYCEVTDKYGNSVDSDIVTLKMK